MKLSNRETQVLKCLTLPTKDIAERLQLKRNTIKRIIESLFNKFAPLDSRGKILVNAIKNKIVSIEEIIME